jgi:hypothetical protein
MRNLTDKEWRILSNILVRVGIVAYASLFISLFVLDGYYVARRPQVPQPDEGWTIHLTVSPGPHYGSAEDQAKIETLSFWVFIVFVIPAAGFAIRRLKLNE